MVTEENMKAENSTLDLETMNGDLLADIMARLDGPSLTSFASTCSSLRDMAQAENLWRQLCESTWPSMGLPEAEHLMSPFLARGFKKFYADAYPTILYDECVENVRCIEQATRTTSISDFVSLVDVFWKNECVLSRVLGFLPNDLMSNEYQEMFLDCPFGIELLDDKGVVDDADNENVEIPQVSNAECNKNGEDNCKNLMENMRLSWIVLDKNTGKAVNLSSWKPYTVSRAWPYSSGEHTMYFRSIIPVEGSVSPHRLAKCLITTRFKMLKGEECLQWKEINMTMENIRGDHINGRESLMVLNQAFYSFRSTNRVKVEQGYCEFDKRRREETKKEEVKEALTNRVYMLVEVLVFGLLCYAFVFF